MKVKILTVVVLAAAVVMGCDPQSRCVPNGTVGGTPGLAVFSCKYASTAYCDAAWQACEAEAAKWAK